MHMHARLILMLLGCTCTHVVISYYFYSEYSESIWQLVGVAKTDQLGSNERIQEKIDKIKQFARAVPAVSSGDGAEVEGLRDALRAVQMRERELNRRIGVIKILIPSF